MLRPLSPLPRRRPAGLHGRLAALALALVLGPGAAVPRARADDAVIPTPEAIDVAIEQGVAWVLGERKGGRWGSGSRALGHTALAAFALFHSGLDPAGEEAADAHLAFALRWLDGEGPGRRRGDAAKADTYGTSLLLLTLLERDRSEDRERIQRLVQVLVDNQAKNGQWHYGGRGGGRRPPSGDNSNSQFAVLALGRALGAGHTVDAECLRRAWAWWRGAAQRDGGFGYSAGGSRASASTGSMTAAGIASLSILEAALRGQLPEDADGEAGPTVERALARLAEDFAVNRNFGPAAGGVRQRQRLAGRGWVHYFLWSVERGMVLAGREHLGTRDWYAEGAAHLLATQKDDGSWRGEHPLYATCFALLFLSRAADPPRVFTPSEAPTGPRTAPDERPAPTDESPPATPADVKTLLGAATPPETLQAACLDAGPACLPILVRALGHRDRDVRRRAHEALRTLLGEDRVGRADRHPLARGRLLHWVRRHRLHLRVEDGRFVPSVP